jgi:hypothetical protein
LTIAPPTRRTYAEEESEDDRNKQGFADVVARGCFPLKYRRAAGAIAQTTCCSRCPLRPSRAIRIPHESAQFPRPWVEMRGPADQFQLVQPGLHHYTGATPIIELRAG